MNRRRKPRADDDDDWGECYGFGDISQLTETKPEEPVTQRAIGFVHFPEKPEKPKRRPVARKAKRRKR